MASNHAKVCQMTFISGKCFLMTDLGMMFDRHEAEHEPVEELDAIHAWHAHVEEDAEEDREGDQLEDGSHQHRQTWTKTAGSKTGKNRNEWQNINEWQTKKCVYNIL